MAEQDNPVFYKLVNSVTGHYYLGATATPIARERDHLAEIRAGKKGKLWQQMWNDHPQTRDPAVWRFHIVRRYPDMEATVQCEHAFLQTRVSNDHMCLNRYKTPHHISPSTGEKKSLETRMKISTMVTAAGISGSNHPMYGKPSPFKGKTHSDQTKDKLRDIRIGENNPFYGKTHSSETIDKIRESSRGENNGMYGKTHSPEARAKQKATKAAKRYTKAFFAWLSDPT